MFIAWLLSAATLLSAVVAAPAPAVSHTRVAYVVGPPFLNGNDRYGKCVSLADPPRVLGHEPISVGVGCSSSDGVRLSAVMAAISWISAHGETDATVVISRHHRGHSAVEAALQALRDKGLTVPQHHVCAQPHGGGAFQPGALLAGAVFAATLMAALRAVVLGRPRRPPETSKICRKRSRSAPALRTPPLRAPHIPPCTAAPSRHSFDVMPHKERVAPYDASHVGHHGAVVPCRHGDRCAV